ncbi:FecR family protein [Pedobacter nyackensis]|uniref:FecR family protein n=1 Tax=Pedobacter nyackensis TaxID=475255 RepID=A0A1W2A7T4_9SPHI|nr:FecR family protein [Pedobacter nyackensis]SMC56481.1 FecR family protein [Pedobacter nyackensis]
MDENRLRYLYQRFNERTASDTEVEEFYLALLEPEAERLIKSIINKEWDNSSVVYETEVAQYKAEEIYQHIISKTPLATKTKQLWPRIAAAAAIILAIGVGVFFYMNQSVKETVQSAAYVNDIDPGKQGATLTLANGKKIKLADAANGEIAQEAGITVTKTADGQLVYAIKETNNDLNKINTLSTAKGETYKLRLPDGSLVWLNAASSLTYSANLKERGKRRVRLDGEAYFEIARDNAHPFVVESKGQQVEVLGTHFNVNAYKDEVIARTTLLEGSVNINGKILKPNQQAELSAIGIKIRDVDAQDAIAWKEGYFTYNGETLSEIMKQVARWYDVEVIFEDAGLKEKTFLGSIGRFEQISKVLNMLSRTEVASFTIEGKTIKIKKKNK